MKIRNAFRIPLPPDQAWEILNDVPRVATCVPGAQLLQQNDDGSYLGTVAVRLGPIALSFKGRFEYKNKNEAARRVSAEASGTEQKARGTARATVDFQLDAEGSGTKVSVETDVQLAGSIAQYARGGTLIETTAQVLMDQFARNLEAELQSNPHAADTQAEPMAAATPHDAPQDGAVRAAPAAQAAASPPPSAPRPARTAPKEISGLGLMLQTLRYSIRRWIRNLSANKG